MPAQASTPDSTRSPLLAPSEPPPFQLLGASSRNPVFLLCDHASRRIPAALGNLGLATPALHSHLAWDIGAAAVTRQLAKALSLPAILAGYSRLVVDCNRALDNPEAFLTQSDGVTIHGNRQLSEAHKNARAEAIHQPYHAAIAAQLDRMRATGQTPVLLSIHSFTPIFEGQSRPWHAGVLWEADCRVPDLLLPALRNAGLTVGDNQPYPGSSDKNFTVHHHGKAGALPHAVIELRQDLIADTAGVQRMTTILEPIIRSFPAALFQPPGEQPDP